MSFSNATTQTGSERGHLDSQLKQGSLRFRACFLLHPIPGRTRSSLSNTSLQSIDTCPRRRNFVRPTDPRTSIVRCKQADGTANPSELEGEIREVYERSIRENPIVKTELQDSDRRVMDDITATGAAKMNEIVSNMKEDLKGIQEEAAERAAAMIQEESDLLLEKYEQKRLDILDRVKSDRQVIKDELTKLESLAGDMKKGGTGGKKPMTEKLLLASTTAFSVAALFYAWNGFVNSDASALSNAAIDAIVAAAAGYFASRRRT